MIPSDLLGIFFALTSALVWGSGDFSGGLAARRSGQFQVLALAALSGVIMLVLFAIWWGEPLPSASGAFWAGAAGVSGAVGIACLYRGLSLGNAAVVAPSAAVISAALPVIYSLFALGAPRPGQLAGFALALLGIWLVSSTAAGGQAGRQALLLALLAGLGFGGFFILIAQVEPGLVFTPLIVARTVSLGVALLLLLVRRAALPALTSNPVALAAGLLDSGGNIFFLLAQQFTRLDVAAVLSSLYPATTVLLAYLILKETVSPAQWLGAACCLGAVVLIAL
jgi:drug/metabolite transporter (DMT)-like permease